MTVCRPPSCNDGEAALTMHKGAIRWFDPSAGHGFIVPDAAADGEVWFHVSAVEDGLKDRMNLQPGTRVAFEAVRNPKGLRALRVVLAKA
jgi:cold shock CspA family protein